MMSLISLLFGWFADLVESQTTRWRSRNRLTPGGEALESRVSLSQIGFGELSPLPARPEAVAAAIHIVQPSPLNVSYDVAATAAKPSIKDQTNVQLDAMMAASASGTAGSPSLKDQTNVQLDAVNATPANIGHHVPSIRLSATALDALAANP